MSDLGNKKVMSYNIKRLLKEHNKTRRDLAKATGINYNTMPSWIQGKSYPRIDRIELMANYFHVPKSALVERQSKPDNELTINKVKNIPLVGSIAMGTPITAEQNIEGFIPEYFIGDCPSGNLFALRCKGHSMEPTIPDGAIAIFEATSQVEDGEIAAVLLDHDEEATLKRVQHSPDGQIFLKPDNNSFPTIALNDKNPGRIIGRLYEFKVLAHRK